MVCRLELDQSEEELEQSDNPFALVLMTVKAALKCRKRNDTEEDYLQRKLELVDWLKKKPITPHQEKNLLSFLKEYVPFKDQALEIKFNEQLKERSEVMGLVESLISEAKEKGLEQGLQEGIEKGKLSVVRRLLKSSDFDDEKIADLAAVGVNRVRRMRTNMVIN